ncbi:MAG: OsmC family protein [Pseudomonadota bacterium]|uniref:OsmC family protein n=1 Tax=Pseudohongiella sp. O18 TaxID=2904248 RepID=UPI001F2E508E|nr:OsmC family protein [Pseudohongiella sp. O18]MEC8859885.1 OsmC family protein [Pseudomonadota bacterium]
MSSSISVKMRLLENYVFEIDFGEFGNIISDEPPPIGDGEGPSPSAMLAASVANCMSASLLFALRKQKEDPGELHATVTGTTERVDNYLRITSLAVTLKLGKAASEYRSLDKVLPVFENYCVVTQSVKRGIPVTVDIQDADGEKVVV